MPAYLVVIKGFKVKAIITGGSCLSGWAYLNPCGSAVVGFGSNWGYFGSYSEVCTHEPFHSWTISWYGNLQPERSEIM